MKSLLIGSRNPGKVREIRNLLRTLPLRIDSLEEHPSCTPPLEEGRSYRSIAEGKALHVAEQTGMTVLADDSGLEVEVLEGRPGVLSARYAGEGATDRDRLVKLLGEVEAAGVARSPARFRCAIAVAVPGEVLFVVEGECRGEVGPPPRGDGGFGYDPIFTPSGYDRTFGELPGSVKDEISHRARALAQLRLRLAERLGS